MKCKHYKGDGYEYKLSSREHLYLCHQCHLNLAGELMGQLAIESFGNTIVMNILTKKKK